MDKLYGNPEIWGGIECTINRVQNQFLDQLNYSGHYHREDDLEAIASLGIKKMRYPVLWERHQPKKDSLIDWSWTEKRLEFLRQKNIDVIAGLVHHGSGPAFTKLSDRNFPELLAAYARKVAEKFPWLEYYTPVNEPLTTARFSGLYGIWYPHHSNAKSFMQMLLNELKATVLSIEEIRKINPSAKLVQTEDLGKTYSTRPLRYQASFENERRWLTYDILCGRFNSEHRLWKYFHRFAIPEEDFQFFLEHPCPPDIFGFNHYLTSERFLDHRTYLYPPHTHGGNGRNKYADVEAVRVEVEEETGVEVLLKEAWERYQKPMAITEVHLHCHREEQLRWFREVWQASKKLRSEGVDLRAVTTWAMLGSYGWNKLLTEPGGEYEPGAFDLRSGKPRPTALVPFIKEIAERNEADDHLSKEKGWWLRDSRLIYQALNTVQMISHSTPPILIIGKNGTLGRAFARICEDRCLNHRLLSRQDCDISDLVSIEKAIAQYRPWAIINAAGYVRVDDAERDIESCMKDNTLGPHNLAIACKKSGLQLINFSSDLVFDGKKNQPYMESDEVSPLNVYGRSKAESEILLQKEFPSSLLIRTSAFFGPWDEYNFVHYVRRALSQYEEITVAGDIIISPTYVPHLVNTTLDLLVDEEKGIWHLSNAGAVSWSELAHEIADRFELDKKLINTVTHDKLNYAAPRPLYSVLASERGQLLPPLKVALDQYFQLEKTEKRKVA